VPEYAREEGGAVLNAAITRYVTGSISCPESDGFLHKLRGNRSHLSYTLDLPSGAGLGASAAQNVLWTALVKTTIANVSERSEIAEIACGIGALLGIVGGKQDEYASALGGITYYTFDEVVHPHRLDLSPALLDTFRSRLVLVYTGKRRLSSSIHQQVWTRFQAHERIIVEALGSLKRIAAEMKEALIESNLEAFAQLLNENWTNQKALHSSVTNPFIDGIFDYALQNGAAGGKACGAGGGGCLVLLAKEGHGQRLRGSLKNRKVETIEFDFDMQGVYVNRRI
jgi:D-glycero-alpha-D-manno-heptose-7-phosphate kinase